MIGLYGGLSGLSSLAVALRSIPANAGEPIGALDLSLREGVYPRPRGGTALG